MVLFIFSYALFSYRFYLYFLKSEIFALTQIGSVFAHVGTDSDARRTRTSMDCNVRRHLGPELGVNPERTPIHPDNVNTAGRSYVIDFPVGPNMLECPDLDNIDFSKFN